MMGLPDDRKSFKIGLAVYIPARDRQTDRQTDIQTSRQTRNDSKDGAYASSRGYSQWLKWFCEAGGTPYPFQPH